MKNIKKSLQFILIITLFVSSTYIIRNFIGKSKADILINGTEVERDSTLTYYLNVNYDGIDASGVNSENGYVTEVKSGNLYITDKIPEGLEFQGFVETSDGSIGAVKKTDNSKCLGTVLDDTGSQVGWNGSNEEYTYHGLHYNRDTNTVSFTVKNLKAGCYLTVGIKTKTPEIIDLEDTTQVEKRRDFYNFASAKENALTVNSNTVHVFIGKDNIDKYDVNYEYDGNVPSGAPSEPEKVSYAESAKVKVAADPEVTGYSFSGWETEDANITRDTFTMPNKEVTLKGSFTEKPKYKVSYQVNSNAPDDYVAPKDKRYYADTTVEMDVLKAGDIVDNYEFNGWETNNVTVDEDNEFVMPSRAVTFVGTFEEVKHTVTYAFYTGELPPNANNLLPRTREYSLGETVKLENPGEVQGYEFLGWYHDDNFEMPNEDVTIYGEWKRKNGEFEPELKVAIEDKKDLYSPGDKIKFRISVKNNNDFPIKDVAIEDKSNEAIFIEEDDYEKINDNLVSIPVIEAKQSVNLYATLKIAEDMSGDYTNTFRVVGAIADNYYELSKEEIKASAKYSVAKKVDIGVPITGKSTILIVTITLLVSFSAIGYTVLVMKKKNKN